MPDISFHLNSGSNNCATLVDNDDCGQIHPFSSPRRVASALLRDQRSLFRLCLISTHVWVLQADCGFPDTGLLSVPFPQRMMLFPLLSCSSGWYHLILQMPAPQWPLLRSLFGSLMSPECLLYQHISLWSIGLRGQYRVIDPIMPFSCLCVMLISPHPCTASLMSPLAGSLSLST